MAINLLASQTWTNASGSFTINNPVNGADHDLTFVGNHSFRANGGTVNLGADSLTYQSGTLDLQNNPNIMGNIFINGGNVFARNPTALGTTETITLGAAGGKHPCQPLKRLQLHHLHRFHHRSLYSQSQRRKHPHQRPHHFRNRRQRPRPALGWRYSKVFRHHQPDRRYLLRTPPQRLGQGLITGNILSGTGGFSLAKDGTGTWTLAGDNTYQSGTIDELFLDGFRQKSGSWGAPGSDADHETDLISGIGRLLVMIGEPCGFLRLRVSRIGYLLKCGCSGCVADPDSFSFNP